MSRSLQEAVPASALEIVLASRWRRLLLRIRETNPTSLAHRHSLPQEPESSLLRFAAVWSIKRKKDLASLAPQRGLVSTEAVKGEVGQIGKS
jgi:hypothetical protein